MDDSEVASSTAAGRESGSGGFMALPRGTRLDAYIIDTVIGAGGFGITYLAHHATLSKPYALKEYFPRDFAYRENLTVRSTLTSTKTFSWGLNRFLDEARALARFKHPAIVDVAHVFEANGTAYIALAYEQGRTFGAWLQELRRKPTQAELDALAQPLLDAMEVIHKAGMLHRDIAADNILVRDDGSPVLIDFGSARADIRDRAAPLTAVVKPGNSPPEQYNPNGSEQGPWSDIYAFAATLYKATTGRQPIDAMQRAASHELMSSVVAVDSGYRESFLHAIDWGMALDPTRRPQSIAEWRERLLGEPVREERTIPPLPPQPIPPPPITDWTLLKRIAAAGAVILTLTLVYTWNRPASQDPGIAIPSPPVNTTTTDRSGANGPAGATQASNSGGSQSTNSSNTTDGQGTAQNSANAVNTTPGPNKTNTSAKVQPPEVPVIEVSLELPKKTFAIGDAFSFTLKANRDCNFLVFTIDADDKVELHDPVVSSAFMGPAFLKAGEVRQIPIAGAPGRAIVNPPSGPYQVGAVCAREELSKLGLSGAQLKTPASGGKRSFGFKVEEVIKGIDRKKLGRVTVGYEVK